MMCVDMYLTDGNLGSSLRANRRIAPSGNGDLNLHHAFQRWVRCGGRRLVAVVDSTHAFQRWVRCGGRRLVAVVDSSRAFQRWVRCGDPPSHTRVPEKGTTWGLEQHERLNSPHHAFTRVRVERPDLTHHELRTRAGAHRQAERTKRQSCDAETK